MIKLERDDASLPPFTLAPETFFDKIEHDLRWHDIDFPEDQYFSKAYTLKGSDRVSVRALFTAQLRSQLAPNPGQHVAGAGNTLFWWRFGNLPQPNLLEAFLEAGARVRNVIFGS